MVQAGSSAAPRAGDHGNSVNVNSQNEHEPLPELRKLLEARSWKEEEKKKIPVAPYSRYSRTTRPYMCMCVS